jgi:uncharacterized protein
MDPDACGSEVLNHFTELKLPFCDFLIPITNNCVEANPSCIATDHSYSGGLQRFVLSAFDAWITGGANAISVRLFESLIKNALGMPHGDLNAGSRNIAENLILETDGQVCLDPDFWYIDRFSFGKIYSVKCAVQDPHFSLREVSKRLDAFASAHRLRSIPTECQSCSMRSVCRGSHPASRFGVDGSFDHRSAYCELMFNLSCAVVDYLRQGRLTEHLIDPDLTTLLRSVPDERNSHANVQL